jgi:DNA-directed RNA polymerase subunit RPC12/RpoP
MEIELPLDGQGFLRRECPACERRFKWHHGPTGNVPDDAEEPDEYFCPYCGVPASLDQWWTNEQVEAIQAAAAVDASQQLESSFKKLARTPHRSPVQFRFESAKIVQPPPLFEGDDMSGFASPCHPYEPIKVIESEIDSNLHCLVCGQAFRP